MKIDELKIVATELRTLIEKVIIDSPATSNSLQQVIPFIEKAISANSREEFSPQRLRFDSLFIDGDLANNSELADVYSKFANLYEGLEV